ncbi:23S rRNA (guanosine(2251)-2'-O)-methyltransferase RlmB [Magnetospirillum sulfuroxidans]|uniref:23S rRNA (Guanosine(2251)-2'-O)-methyltransferase RlmB n=1 Tax=Magnetospirillum sulfuroxidans TaxID=611300 RepID=A0ABS5IHQ8_9PROT|nr:23S rRNA (guanosine(2251)-2'-O)-methyltransferase RlmB [Magnetospirillum sulfuroxidans]MBR9973920.1 23S rRNA (guanosine(2251)-2'-O)-methyltransferase RlmB [Magnetospirillum sulfuroxidans]
MTNWDSRSKSNHKRDAGKGAERPAKLPSNQLWLYGVHAVVAALANKNRKIRRIVLTAEALRTHAPALAHARSKRPLPGEETTDRAELDRLLPPGAVHQGIAVLAEHLDGLGIEDVGRMAKGREHAVVMVLDQVTDPHNVGAILRSAAAFGALAVVVPDRHSPEETGALAKSASGALEVMPLVRVTNMVRALEQLQEAGFWTAGLAGEATNTIAAAKLSGKIALVMGAEGEGLRRLTREHCDHLVKLPMTGLVESLNVSNAAAIALYELVREQDLASAPTSH